VSAQRSIARRWSSTTAPYLLLRGGGQAAEFLGWVVLARRLGTDVFGTLTVAVLVCRYGGVVADWGASIRGVREIAERRSPGGIRALDRRRRQSTAVLAGLYLLAITLLGNRSLLGLVTILISIGLNRDWVALGLERGGRAGAPIFAQGALLLGIAVLAPTTQPAWAPSVAYAVSLLLSLALNRLPPDPNRTQIGATGLRTVDGWMLLAILSNQLLSSADTTLLAVLGSASMAGIYAAVYRLPNGWLALLVILRSSLLPMATTTWRTDRAAFFALRRTSLRWSAMAGAALAGLTPITFVAVPFIFGAAYEDGRWPAVLLMLATAVATAAAPLHHLFLAIGEDRPYGCILLLAAMSNVGINLVLIPLAGMMGAAVATVIANVLLAAVLWRAVQQRLDRAAPVGPVVSPT
jgi:O-antigen/teichoic acid export membrane protein